VSRFKEKVAREEQEDEFYHELGESKSGKLERKIDFS